MPKDGGSTINDGFGVSSAWLQYFWMTKRDKRAGYWGRSQKLRHRSLLLLVRTPRAAGQIVRNGIKPWHQAYFDMPVAHFRHDLT